ncbi:hypothetical protein D3C87_1692950 [compost metagenome]
MGLVIFLEHDLPGAVLQRYDILDTRFGGHQKAAGEGDELVRECNLERELVLEFEFFSFGGRGEIRDVIFDEFGKVGLGNCLAVHCCPSLPLLREGKLVLNAVLAVVGRAAVFFLVIVDHCSQ